MLSTDRILTTHVGSLPRPDNICDLLRQKVEGRTPAAKTFDEAVAAGVDNVVARRRDFGIDIVSDGEFSTFAGDGLVDPEICFAKFERMARDAEIASTELWVTEP